MKHWKYRHRIFLNEHDISDQELCGSKDSDYEREQQELGKYCDWTEKVIKILKG